MLILDEPANGLDPQGVRWLRDFLRSYAAAGRTVLLSSDQLTEVAQTVDDAVVIAAGRLVAAVPLTDLLVDSSPRVLVQSDQPDAAAALFRRHGARVDVEPDDRLLVTGTASADLARAARDAGILLTELTPLRPDLEQRFFDLTDLVGQTTSGTGGS